MDENGWMNEWEEEDEWMRERRWMDEWKKQRWMNGRTNVMRRLLEILSR